MTDIITPEFLAELKKLQFEVKRNITKGLNGQYKSAFKGRGIEFEEVREYSSTDDSRLIDWKVTAKTGKPYIKSYREERELTVVIALDTSGSTFTGTTELRKHRIAKVGAALAMIALNNKDKVGFVTFNEKVSKYFPPQKNKSTTWNILHQVLAEEGQNKKTSISNICHFLRSLLKQRAILFLISDFHDQDYEDALKVINRKHEVTAICIEDSSDYRIPSVGLIQLKDPETGNLVTIDSSSSMVQDYLNKAASEFIKKRDNIFIKHGIRYLKLSDKEKIPTALRVFFQR